MNHCYTYLTIGIKGLLCFDSTFLCVIRKGSSTMIFQFFNPEIVPDHTEVPDTRDMT